MGCSFHSPLNLVARHFIPNWLNVLQERGEGRKLIPPYMGAVA
jgi:hypothetical protein